MMAARKHLPTALCLTLPAILILSLGMMGHGTSRGAVSPTVSQEAREGRVLWDEDRPGEASPSSSRTVRRAMRLMDETMSNIGLVLYPGPAMASQDTPPSSPRTESTGSSTWSEAIREQLHQETGPAIKKPVPETTAQGTPAAEEEYAPPDREEPAGSERLSQQEELPELMAAGEKQPATEEEPLPATGEASPSEERAKPTEGEAMAIRAETSLTVEDPSRAVTHDTMGTNTIPLEPRMDSELESEPQPGLQTEPVQETKPDEPLADSQAESPREEPPLHDDDAEAETVIFSVTPQSAGKEETARSVKARVTALLHEPIFVYDPKDMADPFESFLTQPQPAPFQFAEELDERPEQRRPLTPLMRMSITEVRNGLKAIVWGEMGQRAVIEDPTGRGYIVTRGTEITNNHGFISEIFKDAIVITQTVWDNRERKSKLVNTVIRLGKE